MRKTSHKTRLMPLVLIAGLAAAGWAVAGPRQLGGPVAYVITDGISMEPGLTAGDIVAVRSSQSYEVGDVVAYDSDSLGRIVLHRIVARQGDRYVFKGDNNDWLDTDRPQNADLIGKEWFVIPGGGKVVGWLRAPGRTALFAGVLGLSAVGTSAVSRHKGRRRRVALLPARLGSMMFPRGPSPTAIMILAGLVFVFAMIGIASLRRPETRPVTENTGYTSSGTFAYSAAAPEGPAYAAPEVRTGDPVFLKLVDEVEVAFDYEFASDAPHEVGGEMAMTAEITNDLGWRHRLAMHPSSAFTGDTGRVAGTIDLERLQAFLDDLHAQTGVVLPSYRIVVQPQVTVAGKVREQLLADSFSPTLTFQLDQFSMRLQQLVQAADPNDPTAEPADALHPTQEGTVEVDGREASAMRVLGLELEVSTARRASALGLLLLVCLLVAAVAARVRSDDYDNEVERIEARFGGYLVPIRSFERDASKSAVEVMQMDTLIKLAEHHEQMVLHKDEGDGFHSYFVQGEGFVYSYRARNGLRPASATDETVEEEMAAILERTSDQTGPR